MSLTYKLLYLFIIFCWYADAYMEVFDPYGKRVDQFKDREALDADYDTMEGFIVTTDPPDACFPVEEPRFLTNFSYYKFALINGSESCGYKRKIHFVEQAGYDFAVIFDPYSRPFGPFFEFGIETQFPVIIISYEAGIIIKSNYLYNTSSLYNYRIRFLPNPSEMTFYMYLFGAIIGICFFVMILFMMCLLIKCIQERRRSRRNKLSSRQIKQLPTAKFSKGDQYDVCAICLEDYNEGDKLRILPCSHAYHAKCIDPWLRNNRRNCPLCKRKITFGDSGDESESEDSELTSPAENTPLISSPDHAQSWGTFVNPVRTMLDDDDDTSGPSSSSMSHRHSNVNSSNSRRGGSPAEHPHWSDCLMASPHLSVNNDEPVEALNETEVEVNFVNPFEAETSSTHAASI